MEKFDVCIVGAGVAGATLAAWLGKHGIKTMVVERNLGERDVIVGELLQPGGYNILREMRFESFVENIDAQPVYGYDVIFQEKDCLIKYSGEDVGLTGFGFRNGKFVQNMRKQIIDDPNVNIVEGRVTSLNEVDGSISGFNYLPKGADSEETVEAKLTVVSDGPISRFRQELSDPEVKLNGYFLGVILENCELPYPGHGHLVMGDHPPFVLYPVTSTETRILIDFPGEKPPKFNQEFKEDLRNRFLPVMPEKMKAAFADAIEKGSFKMMPNHRMPANPVFRKGAVLLGDSLNMRHPLTGGGMTATFSDVQNLGNKLIDIKDYSDQAAIESAVKRFYQTRHLGNQTINILADGLYGVVKHHDLKEAFFKYVSRGGKYADEPVAILGGISKDKKLLQKHFFAVANYGTKLKIKNGVGAQKIGGTYSMMKEAVKIISPLLMSEKPDKATRLLLKTLLMS